MTSTNRTRLFAIISTSAALVIGCHPRPSDSASSQRPSASASKLVVAGVDIELVRIAPKQPSGTPFWISRYEITNEQFKPFIDATGFASDGPPVGNNMETFLDYWTWARGNDGQAHPVTFPPTLARHPVCRLDWHDATAYCAWLSKASGRSVRLPRDAEWEWAARGREGRDYPWGKEWDPKRCNWGEGGRVDGFAESAPVGSFPLGATPEGVCDLAGNIWEWTADQHLRGGPWCMTPDWCRCDFVAQESITRKDDKFGIRIVVDEPASPLR